MLPAARSSEGLICLLLGRRERSDSPLSCLGPEPRDVHFSHPALRCAKPSLPLQCSHTFHGKTAKSFASIFKMQPPA